MESEGFSQHISRRFNEELEHVRGEVLRMGGLVEQHLDVAIQSLVAGDSEMGLSIAAEDYKVNRMEVAIDEECTKIIATRGPTAADLRLVITVIKTITDLERIGDECRKLAMLAAHLAAQKREHDEYHELEVLAGHVQEMVREALDAFSRMDADDALAVVEEDKLVDEQYDMITRQCISLMMEDPRTIRRFLDVTWAARALERIGDHAKNIAEYTIYLVHGKDIRHVGIEAAKQTMGVG
jgi:phosphate transport system protein